MGLNTGNLVRTFNVHSNARILIRLNFSTNIIYRYYDRFTRLRYQAVRTSSPIYMYATVPQSGAVLMTCHRNLC